MMILQVIMVILPIRLYGKLMILAQVHGKYRAISLELTAVQVAVTILVLIIVIGFREALRS
jgi:hypothetical protein